MKLQDDTRSILKICEWMREQPNGSNFLDLDLELLPKIEPPALREQFNFLLPKNTCIGEQSGSAPSGSPTLTPRQDNKGSPGRLLPKNTCIGEQIGEDREGSTLLDTEIDRQLVKIKGIAYHFHATKSLDYKNQLNGWLSLKEDKYLYLRWRDGELQRSKYLGKVIKV